VTCGARPALLHREGIALPAVMLLLLGASIVAAGLLHTAAAELIASRAQQAASQELYRLEAGLTRYLASATPFPADWAPGPEVELAENGGTVRVSVVKLSTQSVGEAVVRVFSVTARADASERSLAILVRDSVPALDPSGDDPPANVQSQYLFAWQDIVR
jgi:hypothetical protein